MEGIAGDLVGRPAPPCVAHRGRIGWVLRVGRSAIRERWPMMNQRAAAQRGGRRAKLERKARADVERVAKLAKGNGWGV